MQLYCQKKDSTSEYRLMSSRILFLALIFSQFTEYRVAYALNGEVTFLSGNASLTHQGKKQNASEGDKLSSGDSLLAHENSAVVVTLDDQSLLKLSSNSEITLGGESKTITEVHLVQGGIFAKIRKRKPGQRVLVKTRTAVMGVRGTEFFTSIGRKENGEDPDVWMCVNEGQVEVTTAQSSQSALVNAGEGIFVNRGKEITPPRPYSWTKSLNWNMDPKKGSIQNGNSLDSAYKNLVEQDYD